MATDRVRAVAARLRERATAIALLRIAFGAVWGIDARFKWQPAFLDHLPAYITGAMAGQPSWIRDWVTVWAHAFAVDPRLFAVLAALVESVVAASLVLGAFSNRFCVLGALHALFIWSVPEGFGGPYVAGSTDVGTAIIYVFVLLLLLASTSGRRLGLDRRITPRLGRLGWLAAGSLNYRKVSAT